MATIGTTKIGWKTCPYCGDDEIYRSHRKPLTWLDRVCRLFLLQVVRCHRCELRHYRPMFFSAPSYPHPVRPQKSNSPIVDLEQKKRSA